MSNNLSYISSNIQNGITFDQLVGNLLAYQPDSWGYSEQDFTEIANQFGVDSNNLYYLPAGNYKLSNYENSPFGTETDFINILVYELEYGTKKFICTQGGKNQYYATASSSSEASSLTWIDITNRNSNLVEMVLFHVSETAPTDTSMLWVDISKLTTSNEVNLKYYNGTEWVSYSSQNGVLLQDIYDTEGRKEDVYKALTSALEKYIGEYVQYIEHKNNNLTLIHISSEEREFYDNYILTSEDIAELFSENGDLYNSLIDYIKYCSDTETKYSESKIKSEEAMSALDTHINGDEENEIFPHINAEKVAEWDNKSDNDHSHSSEDVDVTINSTDIKSVNGDTFSSENITNEVKTRIIKIDSFDILQSVNDESELIDIYNNGNTLYTEDESGKCVYKKIIDNTKFGTPKYEKGLVDLYSTFESVKFSDIENKPTTISGYGIIDSATQEDINNIESQLEELRYIEFTPAGYNIDDIADNPVYIGIQKSLKSEGGGTEVYPMSTPNSDLDIIMTIVPGDFSESTVDKFNCNLITATDDNIIEPGFSKVKTEIDAGKYFGALYSSDEANPKWESDGLGRMIEVDRSTDNDIINTTYEANNHTYSMKISWSDTKGIVFTIGFVEAAKSIVNMHYNLEAEQPNVVQKVNDRAKKLSEMGIPLVTNLWPLMPNVREWYDICYGNGTYIAIANNSNIFAYSEDGINWTEVEVSSTKRSWYCVCYGNGMYIAIVNNSNIFAYSEDGINWTEVEVSSTSREWYSICYGDNKFVAVARNCISFIYSTNGINWTEVNVGTTYRKWTYICYGNGKFVVITRSDNVFAYSTDGISWNEIQTNLNSRYWCCISYGNGKFIAVAQTSPMLAYSEDGINWSEVRISETSQYWSSVYYGNNKFVTITYDNNIFAYSTDAKNWTSVTISDDNMEWRSIIYIDGKFISVAQNTNIIANVF